MTDQAAKRRDVLRLVNFRAIAYTLGTFLAYGYSSIAKVSSLCIG